MNRIHPVMVFIYYFSSIILLVMVNSPFYSIELMIFAMISYKRNNNKSLLRFIIAAIPVLLLCMLINPLFNHRGVSLLFYLGDMRITLEAVFFGMHMAIMLLTAYLLFANFGTYANSKRIMQVFAKAFPNFSLLFSMTVKNIPEFFNKFKRMSDLHSNKIKVLNSLISLSLEEGIEKSLSMKAKAYNSGKRSVYNQRKIKKRDILYLLYNIILFVIIAYISLKGEYNIQYFPSIKIAYNVWVYICSFFYFCIPLFIR